MQKSFQAASVTSVSPQQAPLAPLNLLRAGVPPQEVVWFRRLRPDRQMAALGTTRGSLLLEKVREFAASQGMGTAQAMPA
jgi:hypothetical protein